MIFNVIMRLRHHALNTTHHIHIIEVQLKFFKTTHGDLLLVVNEMVKHTFEEIYYIPKAENVEHFPALYGFDAGYESYLDHHGLGQNFDRSRNNTSCHNHYSKRKSTFRCMFQL